MADYDSDSSGADDFETNVLLGYASREPTSDDFSQLGGHPTWLDGTTAPHGAFAKCKVCNGLMNLLLQLNGDLPNRFPGHERRLYLWSCRRKACRRKDGSVRGFRATRHKTAALGATHPAKASTTEATQVSKPTMNLGETLFGVSTATSTSTNPFAMSHGGNGDVKNPFASNPALGAKLAEKPAATESLSETFAQKARISSSSTPTPPETSKPYEEWPKEADFPDAYPSYHVDADKEYLEAEPQVVPSNARLDRSGLDGEGSGSTADEKTAFESSMDKAFQRFADRLAQNPEQILRYEYEGQPLLYSSTDAVGKLLSSSTHNMNTKVQIASSSNNGGAGGMARAPRCSNCGAGRVFELQLTPHAITELEADDMSVEGMDWGTLLLCTCSADCQQKSKADGEIGYLEEWVGVQWEELTEKRRR